MTQNFLTVLVVGIFLIGCSEKRTTRTSTLTFVRTAVPDTLIDKNKLFYDTKRSRWMLNDQLYSGYARSLYPNGVIKARFGILEGKKESKYIEWYADGHLKRIANYHDGKLDGDKKTWSSDSSHILLSHFKYVAGKAHGEQKKWYSTGELFKRMNLNMGKEEGIQQAFRKNGKPYVNYEAKNGRIFGLKRAKLCYELNDEKITFND